MFHRSTPRPGRTSGWLRLAAVTALVMLMAAGVGTGLHAKHAAAASPTALINGATVVGGLASEEAKFATAQGFAVTVVSDATWATYTAAQFGAYDLLIAGDPSCGTLPPGLVASAPVYGSVVLGHAGGRTLAGNRIVVGTDPVLHSSNNTSSPRSIIIKDGIAFAGKQPGRTGMYFDSTCAANYSGQSAETLAILASLSAGSGPWTIDANPPCGGNVSLIASNPSFSDLTTASLEGWGCSVHESFPTFPTDWSALAVATDTASHPTCGTDPNTHLNACGEAYILLAGSSIVVVSGSISLTPADATNPAGTDHTVTAHVTSGGSPLAGQTVTFSVTGQNAGATGTCVPAGCVSDSSGNVSFTYHDSNGAGDDTIKASFTDAAGSLQSATAQKHWVGVVEQPITASGTPVNATEGQSFSGTVATFSDPNAAATASEYSASIAWGDTTSSAGTVVADGGGKFHVTGSHTYVEEGSDTVTVTISDVDTASNTATANSTATVADAALVSTGVPVSATEGIAFTGATVAKFTDANPSPTLSDFSASIDWGDSTAASPGTVVQDGPSSFHVTGSHTYAEEGSYKVVVTIKDVGGSSTVAAAPATVADAALTSTGVPVSATEGIAFTGATVAKFTDANPSPTLSDFSASIDWGDSTAASPGTVVQDGPSSFHVTGSHTYAEEGSYKVVVTIKDVGGSSTVAAAPATVADAALTSSCAMPPATLQAFAGATAKFTDASTTGTLSDFSASINWGDSSSSAGVITGGPGTTPYTVSGSHTYTSTGPFTITTTISDVGGSSTSTKCSVLVFAFAPGGGSFVIGDGNSTVGTAVTFWGAQWAKLNTLSGGGAPNSFKGFAESPASPSCGTSWSADPGNSTPPPNGPLPAFMGVIVTSAASQSGSTISGNTVHIVIVQTNAGYAPNPGHAGTGKVVMQFC